MIPVDAFTTYSQYNEDIILAALLSKQSKGFYVDVGANHEEYHSVTKYFYKRGWHGINIEPIPRLIKEFEKTRKRDINLGIAVSTQKGELLFREYPEHDGYSTLSQTYMDEPDKAALPHKDYKVKVDTLAHVFKKHASDMQIDFLKIDVEGFEEDVLKGNDWDVYRPHVVCIEANHRDTKADWSQYLADEGYKRVIFDGLNEYYVAKEAEKDLMGGYAERVAILRHNAVQNHYMKLWRSDLKHMDELRQMAERQNQLIEHLQHEHQVLRKKMENPIFLVKEIAKSGAKKVTKRKN